MTYLREDIRCLWQDRDPLEAAFGLQGEVFRDVPGRRTLRVQLGEKIYFVKLHYGIGWTEVIKNWLQLKWPVIGARNEFVVCRALQKEQIPAPVPAAFGASSGSMAAQRSFVLSDELAGFTSLEDITDSWGDNPPSPIERQRYLYAVAHFARRFHQAGFIHRDFYICHLLADDARRAEGEVSLAVLDLHRARRFAKVPFRWLKRDLAALLFSSLDLGFNHRDWLRFIAIYSGKPASVALRQDAALWRAVRERADKLYVEGLRKGIVKGLYTP
ncbi:MAG: lipopolysaccharide core heptose(I) kinase RfaP [bacterium]